MTDTAGQPNEEELRAAYEAEMKRIRIEDLLLETVINMVNFGMRRTGLAPGTESERDARQVQLAIESVRALLPLVEAAAPEQIGPIRQALSQLQLAYVQIGAAAPPVAGAPGAEPDPGGTATGTATGTAPKPGEPAAKPAGPGAQPAAPAPKPGEPGPAQSSGRLWVPGR
jgi:hypothetical protein